MYDWVKRQKCFPAFCMRTLSGENAITMEEVEFLKSRDCRIGLVLRDLTEETVSKTNGAEDMSHFGAVFMATEPKVDGMPEKWEPYCPSALEPEDMHLWSCGTTTFGDIEVEDVYARDEKVIVNMW